MKPWFKSRTFWSNIVSVFTIVVSAECGVTITAEEAAAILAVINIILRALTTEPLLWGNNNV